MRSLPRWPLASSGANIFTLGGLERGRGNPTHQKRPAVRGHSRGGDSKFFCLEAGSFAQYNAAVPAGGLFPFIFISVPKSKNVGP
jgi:hypothetical protein